MKLDSFFASYPVFTTTELKEYLKSWKSKAEKNYYLLLNYHLKQGRIIKICRSLYASVPANANPENFSPNLFLVAGKRTSDSILAYHTAQEYYGSAYSIHNVRTFITNRNIKPFEFRDIYYKPVKPPTTLLKKKKVDYGVKEIDIQGLKVRITCRERTFVDMLDRPDLSGSIEEVWRSLEMTEFLDMRVLLEYLKLLENSTTAAKVGFFLETHRKTFNVENSFLHEIEKLKPKSIHYLDRSRREKTRVSKKWNLAIPESLLELEWEE